LLLLGLLRGEPRSQIVRVQFGTFYCYLIEVGEPVMDVLTVSQSTSRGLAALDDIVEGNIVKICKHVLQKLLTGSSAIAIGENELHAYLSFTFCADVGFTLLW
jgi:hypothetical protein